MTPLNGTWRLENGLAVHQPLLGDESRYTEDALRFAIETTKRFRECYLSQESYAEALRHLEAGLGMFPVNRLEATIDDLQSVEACK